VGVEEMQRMMARGDQGCETGAVVITHGPFTSLHGLVPSVVSPMVQSNTTAAVSSGSSIKSDRSALRKIAISATTPAATAETTAEINGTKIDQNLKGFLKGIPAASAAIPTPINRLNRRTNAASNRIDHLPRDVRGIDKTR
jgi:hypothetical protein